MLRSLIRKSLRSVGFDLIRFNSISHPEARRIKLIVQHGITLMFDVGANAGQYGEHIRELGYRGRIVSFEPLTSAYKQLVEKIATDPLWDKANIALGDYDGEAEINIAGNSFSSSILDMLPVVAQSAPGSGYIGKEKITVRRIDSIIDKYRKSDDRIFLKIDTQGFEKNVIEGAERSYKDIVGVQMEVSLVPLYKDETLLAEMVNFMMKRGYTLMSLEPGFSNPDTGQLLQVDCIFFRE